MHGVMPLASSSVGSAPWANRRAQMSAWPRCAARCMGVRPSPGHDAPRSAFAMTSALTHSKCPSRAATMRGVAPPSRAFSVLALCASSSATASAWPCAEANHSAVHPSISASSMHAVRSNGSRSRRNDRMKWTSPSLDAARRWE